MFIRLYIKELIITILIISLIFQSYPLARSERNQTKPIISLINYNEFGEITQNGFIFHMTLEIEKDGKSFEPNDFNGHIGQSTVDSLSYSMKKNIITEDSKSLLFDYEITTPFFIGSFDFIPKIKGYSYPEYAWYSSQWRNKTAITIDKDQVPSNQVNFPFLFNTTSDSSLTSYAKADGSDIFFTNENEDFKYNHEIDYYSSANGDLIAHVNITFLSSTSDTTVYMYYNNPSASNQTNAKDVWDSEFLAVYHMNNLSDSTKNDYTLINDGADFNTNGKFGGCYEFIAGNQDSMYNPTLLDSITSEITYEVWFDADIATNVVFLHKGNAFVNDWMGLGYHTARDCFLWTEGGTETSIISTNLVTLNTWAYTVGSYKATNNPYVYLDDVRTEDDVSPGTIGSDAGSNFWIGSASDTAYWHDGFMDEIRISGIQRSNDWLTTSFNTMNNGSNGLFFSYDVSAGLSNLIPVTSNPSVANNSIGNEINFIWNCSIVDDWSNFNYTIWCSNGDSDSANNQSNGTYGLLAFAVLVYSTEYKVWVNVTEYSWASDTNGWGIADYYIFTTKADPGFTGNITGFSTLGNFTNYDWLSISGVRAVGVKPADIKLNGAGFVVAEFEDNKIEYIQANMRMPTDLNFSNDIGICIGWSSPAVYKVAGWEVEYMFTSLDDDTDKSGVISQGYANSSTVADGLVLTPIANINSSGFNSSNICIHLQIFRNGTNTVDNLSDIAEIHGIAMGYFVNVTDYLEESDLMNIDISFSVEIIMLLLYLIAIILILTDRYSMIILGMILGLFATGIMYNEVTLFHFEMFIVVSSAIFLVGGIGNGIEKAIADKKI